MASIEKKLLNKAESLFDAREGIVDDSELKSYFTKIEIDTLKEGKAIEIQFPSRWIWVWRRAKAKAD